MCDPRNVLDKDGISAMCVGAEMCAYLKSIGRTLHEQLNYISLLYGYHINNNSYVFCNQTHVMLNIFDRLRHFDQNKNHVSIHRLHFSIILLIRFCRREAVPIKSYLLKKKLSFNIRTRSSRT